MTRKLGRGTRLLLLRCGLTGSSLARFISSSESPLVTFTRSRFMLFPSICLTFIIATHQRRLIVSGRGSRGRRPRTVFTSMLRFWCGSAPGNSPCCWSTHRGILLTVRSVKPFHIVVLQIRFRLQFCPGIVSLRRLRG